MRKIILSGFAIVLIGVSLLLVISLSAPKESNYSLNLVVDSWSDQDIDYPEDEFYFDTIALNETYTIPLAGNPDYYLRKFKVIKIRENYITISTPIPLSDKEGGINLLSKKRKFVIEADKSLILHTLLMDGGEVYKYTSVEKE